MLLDNRYFLLAIFCFLLISCGNTPPGEDRPEGARDTVKASPIREMLQVNQPLPNQDIRSPLVVKGEAKGTWFFEGSFPVNLLDKDKEVLARGIAEAQGTWMTEEMVPFKATLSFESPGNERGYLEFEKANPSGLPEHARSYRQPVIFQP